MPTRRFVSSCIPHTNRCHYVSDGSIDVSIRIDRSEYFIPVGVLLRALTDIPERNIYEMLVGTREGGHESNKNKKINKQESNKISFAALRAELILQQTSMKGYPVDALLYLILANYSEMISNAIKQYWMLMLVAC